MNFRSCDCNGMLVCTTIVTAISRLVSKRMPALYTHRLEPAMERNLRADQRFGMRIENHIDGARRDMPAPGPYRRAPTDDFVTIRTYALDRTWVDSRNCACGTASVRASGSVQLSRRAAST